MQLATLLFISSLQLNNCISKSDALKTLEIKQFVPICILLCTMGALTVRQCILCECPLLALEQLCL